jgi:hypothetical protein
MKIGRHFTITPGAILLLVGLGLAGCSQAAFQHSVNYGQAARITCYSGALLTVDDFSTGRVESEGSSDGWHYVSVTTGRLFHASGACYIDYGVARPANFKAVLPPVTQ